MRKEFNLSEEREELREFLNNKFGKAVAKRIMIVVEMQDKGFIKRLKEKLIENYWRVKKDDLY